MNRINFDRSWTFKVVNERTLRYEEAGVVDLPHDYSITQKMDENTLATASNAYLPGGVLDYSKKFFVPDEWIGKRVVAEFEGVYMNSIVRLNSNQVGRNPYGYTSFHCDLTPYLLYGKENMLTVTVNANALPNTRWYSGSGIYRHVSLLMGGDAHIEPWGVFVTTPRISGSEAEVDLKTTLCLLKPGNYILRHAILDADGNTVAVNESASQLGGHTVKLKIEGVKLWSHEAPYLYTVVTTVMRNKETLDEVSTRFGVRTISFDAKNGFRLNGTTVKMKGGCVHHDCGLLGSASYDRAEYRKVEMLKQSGYNAVRCAHNPPSPAFLDACDELGMLVIDEAFDCWLEPKMINDYSNFFAAWWQKDLSSMILRDRNHPSVVMWSIGNEIPERDGRSNGYATAKMLADEVRRLDGTRAITNALCDLWQGQLAINEINPLVGADDLDPWAVATDKFAEPLDVVGYNYMLDRYEGDGTRFPDRVICGTETFPNEAFDYWNAVEKFPHVIGDFVWTSLDYLGEAGIGRVQTAQDTMFCGNFPWSHANCGDIDICGFKRPQSYYRDCVWGINEKPYIAVHHPCYLGKEQKITRWGWLEVYPCWTWPSFEGKALNVDVYSADDEVELLHNGRSIGKKTAGRQNRYIANFTVEYAAGELIAVGYRGGKEVSSTLLRTSGPLDTLRLTPDREKLKAEFGDLSFITIEVLDQSGNASDNADAEVFVTVSGVGSLIAVGSGNARSDEMFVGNTRRLHYGRMMAVVRSDGKTGDIVVTACANGIKTASIKINVK